MHTIYDLEECVTNDRNGTYGGQAGMKEGVTWNGQNWIIKYPKSTKGMTGNLISYMTSPLSEYIGSHIYEILGYDVHETKLGIRDNTLVVACKDFCEYPGQLREVRTLKNVHNRTLVETLERSYSSSSHGQLVDLNELFVHFKHNPIFKEIIGLEERFWDCVIVDVLINNNDRNNGNWGLLYRGQNVLAPIFDNGAAFYNKTPEEKMIGIMNDPERLRMSALETRTIYSMDEHIITAREILCVNNSKLREALQRNIPLIRNKMPQIKSFINEIPEEYKGKLICSKARKEYYIKGMELRIEHLLEPALEKHINFIKQPNAAELLP